MAPRILTLLIIDDSKAEHTLYREYLENDEHHAFRFLHAYTGEEGERIYREQPVDCVLLDYHLPDISGLEVLRRLKDEHAVPAIMLAGEGNEMVAVEAMKLGALDYLPKQAVTPSALKRMAIRAAGRAEILRRMERYRRQLERSNRDLERFANVVAHDLKAPLRAISQHLALIERQMEGKLGEDTKKSMDFAIGGAKRMQMLIDAVVEYSRVGFGRQRMQPVDCNLVLDNVQSNLAAVIQEKSASVTHDPLPVITGDSAQILQLLQNLVSNALKFCDRTPLVHVSARRESEHWVFSVTDNGIGIAPQYHDKIFTIFRRLHTEREYPGSGIGLAICERVVRNHGGRIWVESVPGQGTGFFFALPVSPKPEE